MSPAVCRIIGAPHDAMKLAKNLEESEVYNKLIRVAPWLDRFTQPINPNMKLGGIVGRIAATRAVLLGDWKTKMLAAQATLADKPTIKQLFSSQVDDRGRLTLRTKGGDDELLGIGDLLDKRLDDIESTYDLTPEQLEGIEYRKDMWQDVRDYVEQFGGDKLTPDDAADLDKFPRRILHQEINGKVYTKGTGTRSGGAGGQRPVRKSSGSSARARAAKEVGDEQVELTQLEMFDEGWHYKDPDLGLIDAMNEYATVLANLQTFDAFKQLGVVKTKKELLGKKVKTGIAHSVPAERFAQKRRTGAEVLRATGVEPDANDRIAVMLLDDSVIPAFGGHYVPTPLKDIIEESLRRPEAYDIPILSTLASEARGAVASVDFGTIGIQLILSLGSDLSRLPRTAVGKGGSNIFLRTVGESFRTMFRPKSFQDFLVRYKDVTDRWSPYLGNIHGSDYFPSDRPGQNVARRTLHRVERPFARFFEASLAISKILHADAFERIHGVDMTPADREKLGSFIRNVTGTTDPERMGISSRQVSIEHTFLLFSHRYTRSLFAMVGSLAKLGTDKTSREAWQALSALSVAGIGTYYAAATALGQQPSKENNWRGLNPNEPGFLSLRIGDNWVGVGGGIKAMTQLLYYTYDDPKSLLAGDFDDNPLLRFWRSRSSPIASTAVDLVTGEDFRGRPIDLGLNWDNLLLKKGEPFVLQAFAEANGSPFDKMFTASTSMIGANTNPLTARQEYDMYLKSIRRADGELRFPDGADSVNTSDNGFRRFTEHDDTAQRLKKSWEEARIGRGDETMELLRDREERLKLAESSYKRLGDGRLYRQQVNSIRANSREAMEALALDFAPRTADKRLVGSWYDLYDNVLDPITGEIDSDALDIVQEQWRREHPGEYERLIEPNELTGATPLETKLRRDRRFISDAGWWETDDEAWETLKSRAGGRLDRYDDVAAYIQTKQRELRNRAASRGATQPEATATALLNRDRILQAFSKIRTRQRFILQRKTPGLTEVLALWGYNEASKKELYAARAAERQYGPRRDESLLDASFFED